MTIAQGFQLLGNFANLNGISITLAFEISEFPDSNTSALTKLIGAIFCG